VINLSKNSKHLQGRCDTRLKIVVWYEFGRKRW